MIKFFARQLSAAVLAVTLGVSGAQAQQTPEPTPAAMAMAKEIIVLKGAGALYDPVVGGVVDRSRQMLLQSNPMVGKPLEEVGTKLKSELAGRSSEIYDIVSRSYAARFSEAELKELLAFYKSPLGQKVTKEEPTILGGSMDAVNDWAGRFGEEVMAKMRQEMRKRGHEL